MPVFALGLVGAVAAYLISKSLTPMYDAKGDILVVAGLGQNATGDVNLNAQQVTTTAATLLTEPPLLQKVISDTGANETTDDLAKQITATPQTNSELVDVVVKDASPTRAAALCNAVMTELTNQVTQQNANRINQAGSALQTQIQTVQNQLASDQKTLAAAQAANQDTTALRSAVSAETTLLSQLTLQYSNFQATQAQNLETASVAAPASTPLVPSSPRTSLNTALGGIAGLAVGGGLAALLEFLDQGLKTPEDVREKLGIPCLGVVPAYDVPKPGAKLSAKQQRRVDAATEAYRRLRTNLLFAAPDSDLRSVVITSARAGEGKTRTAANLAVALASSDKRVVLVDADMRRPSQHRLFAKSLEGGLSELILATFNDQVPTLSNEHATQHPNLRVITSGTIPPNPSELLASKRAALLFHSLAATHDLVVVDTPPADVVTDALAVAADVTATVLVIEAGRTNASQARAVIDSLDGVGANVVGVVLNKAKQARGEGSYYYSYGYSERRQREKAAEANAEEPAGPVAGAIG